jgi:hypothetical protein
VKTFAVPPPTPTSTAAPARPASPRAIRATIAPMSPSCRTIDRPTPPLAPVTTTTLSLRLTVSSPRFRAAAEVSLSADAGTMSAVTTPAATVMGALPGRTRVTHGA